MSRNEQHCNRGYEWSYMPDHRRCKQLVRTLKLFLLLQDVRSESTQFFAAKLHAHTRTIYRDALTLVAAGFPVTINGGWKAGIISSLGNGRVKRRRK